MDEWREYQLKDVCSRLSSGKNIKSREVLDKGKYPVYGGNGLRGYSDKANFSGECAIIGRQGAYCGNVRYFSGTAYMTEHAIVTVANENNSTRFLAYLLSMMHLGRLSGQSAQPGLSVKTLGQQIVKLPSYKLQNQIASVLTILDDKIEINNQINKNLLEQAQSIYSAWFEQFLLSDGIMPSNWHIGTIRDIADIKTNSFNPQRNPGVMLEHYSIPAFDEQLFPVFELSNNVKSNKYILTNNSVLASKLNPDTKRVWRPMCLSKNAVCSTEFIVFEAKNPEHKDFLFSIIDSQPFSDWMCAHTTGSTNSRQRTTPSTTLDFKIAVAPDDVVDEFCSTVAPMYDLISQNVLENQSLSSLRDQLLPKLMTGEIDVSDIDP